MRLIDANSGNLTPNLFIQFYEEIRKLAPPRFCTLRMSPVVFKKLYQMADVPQSIEIGTVPGRLGKKLTKIACVTPPNGVPDGIEIKQDNDFSESMLQLEVHGVVELQLVNFTLP